MAYYGSSNLAFTLVWGRGVLRSAVHESSNTKYHKT